MSSRTYERGVRLIACVAAFALILSALTAGPHAHALESDHSASTCATCQLHHAPAGFAPAVALPVAAPLEIAIAAPVLPARAPRLLAFVAPKQGPPA